MQYSETRFRFYAEVERKNIFRKIASKKYYPMTSKTALSRLKRLAKGR
jgi:hypothetical protein